MNTQQLVARLTALGGPHRLNILALLNTEGRLHVSEIARRMGMSRALLYMHLTKLEEAGFVSGQLELAPDGKSMKYFEIRPFEIVINADYVSQVVANSAEEPETPTPA
ncbi:ArsR/SmtB family transcription factor [Lysinibacter cavernae]|uniref:Putative transcriptional regulator n=1 Tax=Lysinibacter cavernae TaxID=1640652 RepID=A0A7X5R369_9MICO|nr:winged helix-turn-helix domain-containing protein [Lysinibacter cavernae]NIH54530.1 putative transcriptional regulator [Lysinibacter cavernae]